MRSLGAGAQRERQRLRQVMGQRLTWQQRARRPAVRVGRIASPHLKPGRLQSGVEGGRPIGVGRVETVRLPLVVTAVPVGRPCLDEPVHAQVVADPEDQPPARRDERGQRGQRLPPGRRRRLRRVRAPQPVQGQHQVVRLIAGERLQPATVHGEAGVAFAERAGIGVGAQQHRRGRGTGDHLVDERLRMRPDQQHPPRPRTRPRTWSDPDLRPSSEPGSDPDLRLDSGPGSGPGPDLKPESGSGSGWGLGPGGGLGVGGVW